MKRECQFDDDTLECPLYNKPLSPPVHQCRNGHVACGACCEKLMEKECPFCRSRPFAHSRCLAVEKIVESLRIGCQYAPDSCTEMLELTKKEEHELTLCKYRPFECPVPLCGHVTPVRGVLEHFRRIHDIKYDQIVELDPVSRSVKFKMSTYMELPFVLVTADKELKFLIHASPYSVLCMPTIAIPPSCGVFWCSSFGSKSMMYNLKVKASGVSPFFTMETLAVENQGCDSIGRNSELLVLPKCFERVLWWNFDLELQLL